MLTDIQKHLHEKEQQGLNIFSCPSCNGVRRTSEKRNDYRMNFSIDCDRIIHSKAYTRYIDKTQVFYMVKNDHITHRVLHVQLVSKIGRTIGRYLGLNEDLIESIALGHDIGHPPFGHDGETILAEICQNNRLNTFLHNLQSVRSLEILEKGGFGLNLTLQTLDGILCHDGELHAKQLIPHAKKTFDVFDEECKKKLSSHSTDLLPMTLEGCVVRLTDTIAYIGRDIEDAIEIGLIGRDQLPDNTNSLLGNTNGTIVYNLVSDLISNSYQKNYINFSDKISQALKHLKEFNYKNIYLNPKIKKGRVQIRNCYFGLFDIFHKHITNGCTYSSIYTDFINLMNKKYFESNTKAQIVCDFIAGMTDKYFVNQAKLYGIDVSLINND